jgi:hypothetical protein
MNKTLLASTRPLTLVFVLFTAIFLVSSAWLEKKGVDQQVLLGGNLLLFVVSMFSYFLSHRSLRSANPQAFVRSMYAGFMIRFFVLALAAFIYIMISKKDVNKAGLIACAGLYIIYSIVETRSLVKLLKEKKNA